MFNTKHHYTGIQKPLLFIFGCPQGTMSQSAPRDWILRSVSEQGNTWGVGPVRGRGCLDTSQCCKIPLTNISEVELFICSRTMGTTTK